LKELGKGTRCPEVEKPIGGGASVDPRRLAKEVDGAVFQTAGGKAQTEQFVEERPEKDQTDADSSRTPYLVR